jgi:uncharacterized membrane protein
LNGPLAAPQQSLVAAGVSPARVLFAPSPRRVNRLRPSSHAGVRRREVAGIIGGGASSGGATVRRDLAEAKGEQVVPSGNGANGGGTDAGAGRPDADEDARLRQAELIISLVLRGGVLLAGAIIALGAVLFYARYLATGGHAGPLTYPHTAVAVVAGLGRGDPLAVIVLGLLVLLLTPVLRVLVSVVTFAQERDWLYTGITLLVFCILLISFLLGRGGA